MIAFTKRYQLLIYLLVIFLVATVFFSLKTRQRHFFSLLEQGVLAAAYPFQKGIDLVVDKGNAIIDSYVNLLHVKEENRILKNRIANLERKLIGYEEDRRQVRQLQAAQLQGKPPADSPGHLRQRHRPGQRQLFPPAVHRPRLPGPDRKIRPGFHPQRHRRPGDQPFPLLGQGHADH